MIELQVKGMHCGRCVSEVTEAVRSLDPQAKVDVSLERGRVLVEGRSSASELINALQLAGHAAAEAGNEPGLAPAKRGCSCSG